MCSTPGQVEAGLLGPQVSCSRGHPHAQLHHRQLRHALDRAALGGQEGQRWVLEGTIRAGKLLSGKLWNLRRQKGAWGINGTLVLTVLGFYDPSWVKECCKVGGPSWASLDPFEWDIESEGAWPVGRGRLWYPPGIRVLAAPRTSRPGEWEGLGMAGDLVVW